MADRTNRGDPGDPEGPVSGPRPQGGTGHGWDEWEEEVDRFLAVVFPGVGETETGTETGS